jgi:cyclic pyranopterin phosphate synthase
MKDAFGRDITYMRVSVTDRCDLRCRYCMPAEGIGKVPMAQILTYEEIIRICHAAAGLGISRIKVTGGEPLVRRGCPDLVRRLKAITGIEQVTMTTNGQQLLPHLDALLAAGLDAVNISLDTLREDRYRSVTRGGQLQPVLDAVEAALHAGLAVKINCLPMRAFNEDELADLAALAFTKGIAVRFIEVMPVGFGNADSGLSNLQVLEQLQQAYPDLVPDTAVRGNGPAVYYHIPGQPGAIGLISALHAPFCKSCNRIRLTAEGLLKPCLCYEDGMDLKQVLDRGDECALTEALRQAILAKPAAHCFDRPEQTDPRPMVRIGG